MRTREKEQIKRQNQTKARTDSREGRDATEEKILVVKALHRLIPSQPWKEGAQVTHPSQGCRVPRDRREDQRPAHRAS